MTTSTNKTNSVSVTTPVYATLSEIFHCSQVLIPFSFKNKEGENVSDFLQISSNIDSSEGIFSVFNLDISYSKGKLYQLSFNKLTITGKPQSKKVTPFSITRLIDDLFTGYTITNSDDDQRIALLIFLLRECIEKDLVKSDNTGLIVFKPVSKMLFKEQIGKLATELEQKNITFQSHFKVLKAFIDSKVV